MGKEPLQARLVGEVLGKHTRNRKGHSDLMEFLAAAQVPGPGKWKAATVSGNKVQAVSGKRVVKFELGASVGKWLAVINT